MFTILAGALQPLCRGIAGAGKGLIGGVIFKCTSLMKFNFLIKAAFLQVRVVAIVAVSI